jgi:hypothetical protein
LFEKIGTKQIYIKNGQPFFANKSVFNIAQRNSQLQVLKQSLIAGFKLLKLNQFICFHQIFFMYFVLLFTWNNILSSNEPITQSKTKCIAQRLIQALLAQNSSFLSYVDIYFIVSSNYT